MPRFLSRRQALALGAAAGAALLARPASAQQAAGQFRFINAVPDALPLSVLIDGTARVPPVGYGSVTEWVPVATGEASIEVIPQPAAGGSPQPPLVTTTVTIAPDTWVTLLAIGQQVADNVQPWVITDQPPSAAAGGALVRVIHAAVGAPPLHVVASGPITVQFGDVRFNEASSYVGMDAGSYQLSAVAVPPAPALPQPPVFTFGAELPNPIVTGQRPVDSPISFGYSSYSIIAFGRVARDPYLAFLVTTDLSSI
ncbi:MAG: hypothetical protein KatS3mg060_0686 [Dehalococcoidia bacterium]|nr:MAG: hypothetical protein KatS3mg060_0686 [Dehalococcoidia bacterium]